MLSQPPNFREGKSLGPSDLSFRFLPSACSPLDHSSSESCNLLGNRKQFLPENFLSLRSHYHSPLGCLPSGKTHWLCSYEMNSWTLPQPTGPGKTLRLKQGNQTPPGEVWMWDTKIPSLYSSWIRKQCKPAIPIFNQGVISKQEKLVSERGDNKGDTQR